MKTMKKCTLLLIVAFTFSLAAGIFGLTAAFNKTVFAVEGANVAMVDGASVKINGTGIRFQSLIKKTYYDGLAEGKKTGIAIIPADLLQGELDQRTDKAMLLYAAAQAHDDEKYAGYYVYNYALTNIPETSFGRKITARAFVKNGEEYIWADNVQSRSLAYVASAALQADSMGEAKYTAEQKNALNGYITAAVEKVTRSKYAQKLNAGETAVADMGLTITPKYATDDLSDLKFVYNSNNASAVTTCGDELTAVATGYANVSAVLGGKSWYSMHVVINGKCVVSATEETQVLPISLPDGVTATKIEQENNTAAEWGNAAEFTIPEGIRNDQSKHVGYNLKIALSNNYYFRNVITVATATISNEAEWNKYVRTSALNEKKTGHYVLTNDITIEQEGVALADIKDTDGKTTLFTASTDETLGFCGTLDGNGKTVTIKEKVNAKSGLFGRLGKSTIQDLTITNNSGIVPDWHTGAILARVATRTTFKNVTFNINNVDYTNKEGKRNTRYGALSQDGMIYCTFNGVTFNIDGKVSALCGGNNIWLSLRNNSYSGVKINLKSPTACLDEIGHGEPTNSTPTTLKVCIAKGMTETDGVVVLEGIEFNEYPAREVAGEQQVVAADAAAIDLGGYSDYTVTEITCDGEDLGKNPQNLALTENIKKKQGKL